MKAMILAAGRGDRMRPLTDATPKALLSVGQQTLIEHHIAALAGAGIQDVVINVAWLGSMIRSHLGDGFRYGIRIHYSEEPEGALETGGGIFNALPLLGPDPFWLVNGDVRTDFAFPAMTLASGDVAHLFLVDNPEHNPTGDFGLQGDRVARTGDYQLTYSGIALIRPELFTGCAAGRFPLAPLLSAAADAGQLGGSHYEGLWVDVGTPDRLAQAAAI